MALFLRLAHLPLFAPILEAEEGHEDTAKSQKSVVSSRSRQAIDSRLDEDSDQEVIGPIIADGEQLDNTDKRRSNVKA